MGTKRDDLLDDGWTDDEVDELLAALREPLGPDLAVRVADIVAARRWCDEAKHVGEPGFAWAGAHRE